MTMDYLIRLVQMHEDFRLAEIRSLASFLSVDVDVISYSTDSPFLILRIISYPGSRFTSADCAAETLISRSVLSLGIYELWGMTPDQGGKHDGTTTAAAAASYAALHADLRMRTGAEIWSRYREASFKFSVDAYCGKRSPAEKTEAIDGFRYLGFQGPIRMREPEVEFTIFEEWSPSDGGGGGGGNNSPEQHPQRPTLQGQGHSGDPDLHTSMPAQKTPTENHPSSSSLIPSRSPHRLFFGRLLSRSPRHVLALKHDLKRRPYISTTSMDAVLALVSANLAHAGPGRIIYDPFVGTGGFLVAAAEFGASVWGSDIDGRSFRGPARSETGQPLAGDGTGGRMERGLWRNLHDYGLLGLFGDCFVGDLVNSPLLPRGVVGGGWFDGIICDPPYGVREGLRVLGNREPRSDRAPAMIDGVPAHTLPGYVPPKKPYAFERMLDDILAFAAETLVLDGRLAFWMPSANEDEEDWAVPGRAELELLECCVQPFNRWSRRLLVYRRRRAEEISDANASRRNCQDVGESAARKTASDLNPFRRKYFQGFQT